MISPDEARVVRYLRRAAGEIRAEIRAEHDDVTAHAAEVGAFALEAAARRIEAGDHTKEPS